MYSESHPCSHLCSWISNSAAIFGSDAETHKCSYSGSHGGANIRADPPAYTSSIGAAYCNTWISDGDTITRTYISSDFKSNQKANSCTDIESDQRTHFPAFAAPNTRSWGADGTSHTSSYF